LESRNAGSDEVSKQALRGLSKVERKLFGNVIRASVAKKGSRLDGNLERYGPAGSARLLVSVLWVGPVWVLILAIVVVGFVRPGNHPYDAIVPLIVIGGIFISIAVYRFVTAIQEGRRFRQQLPKSDP
jgi:hypothetical protein